MFQNQIIMFWGYIDAVNEAFDDKINRVCGDIKRICIHVSCNSQVGRPLGVPQVSVT